VTGLLPSLRRALPILAALAGAALVAALCFRFVTLRSDLADFLPEGGTPAARLMLEELRSGPATSLILVAVENAPAPELARISRAMQAFLATSGRFALVSGGPPEADGPDERFLIAHRYLLSSVTTPEAFAAPALRADFQRLLAGLASSAAPLVEAFGLADPPGALPELAATWTGGSELRTVDGAWLAPERDRALILCRTRANGLDLAGEDDAAAAIDAAFQAAKPGAARLLVSGPAIFARDAAGAIRADVRLLSIVSTLLVAGLLVWRFRSPLVIAVIAVPVVLGVSVGALAVQLAFGVVQGIAFAFGMVMLGVTVDYPVLLVGHRKRGEAAPATIRRIGRAFNLAVATAALGLTGMIFSGFPGLMQLGLFSAVGVVAAASATRFLLPRLIVAADLAPVSAGDPAGLLRVERWRHYRRWGLFPVGVAALYLVVLGGPRFETDLAHLSPVPASALALDAALRSELGAPDPAQVLVVSGASAEEVLRREEALLPVIGRLRDQGVIGGAEIAARLLPSAATQLARRAALPNEPTLAAAIATALQGLPFRADAFQRFASDVAATRAMPPVTLASATTPLFAARLQPLLFQRADGWYGLVVPHGISDTARFAAAFAGSPGTSYVDVHAESNGIVARTTARAGRWLAIGAVLAVLLLALRLREPHRVARVLGAVGAAGLVTVALLTLLGERLSLIHIVSLQFVAGIGLDYALFFARPQLDAEERARTLRTLVTCNAMAILTFGLLGLCRTPLLHEMGLTVVIGALSAMVFGFLFAGERPDPA
jgi:predicted exporter